MAKILGHNARIYLNGTVVAHTSEVSLNIDIETEGVTDSNSGIWAAHLPTLNRWNVDFTAWHYGSSANFKTVLNLVRNRTLVTLIYETENEVQQNGIGYLTNISTSGGTAAGHMNFVASFIGSGSLGSVFEPVSLAFDGAEGYGSTTRGAYSGSDEPEILIVDSLDSDSTGSEETNRGTFLWAITRTYPRVVIFEVSGIIDYTARTSYITISDPYLTVAGQTSPREGLTVFGSNVVINGTNDIIIQHIKVRVGNHNPTGGILPINRRGISVWDSTNVMLDHAGCTWGMRQLIEVGNSSVNVSVTNSLDAECLHNAEWTRYTGMPSNHGYGSLMREADNLSYKNNVLAYAVTRNPEIKRFVNAVVLNNFIYPSGDPTRSNIHPLGRGISYDGEEGMLLEAAIVGNVVLSTELTKTAGSVWKYAGRVTSDTDLGTKLYVHDNICDLLLEEPGTAEVDRWEIQKEGFEFAEASPIDLSGYTIIPASETEAHVLANAGAKPWYRDPTDQRLINQMAAREGEYVDSVYPRYARVFNWWLIGGGDMVDGFNWEAAPTSMVVNGTTLTLNQNTANVQAVVDYLNTMMPAGTEAYKHYGSNYVGLKTIALGSTESIIVSGDGLADFGIQAGTYYGNDGVADWNYDSYTRAVSTIGFPAEPHTIQENGFTNLQNWFHDMGIYDLTAAFVLESTGNGEGVSTLRLEVSEETQVTLDGTARFYSDDQGTLDESTTWTVTSGALRTIYLKCPSSTSNMVINKRAAVIKFGSTSDGWASGTNAATISGSISQFPNLTMMRVRGNNTISGNISVITGLTYIRFEGSNTIRGSISELTGLTYVRATGSNTLSGSIDKLIGLEELLVIGLNTLRGDISNLVDMKYLWVLGSNALTYSQHTRAAEQRYFFISPAEGRGWPADNNGGQNSISQAIIDNAAVTWDATTHKFTLSSTEHDSMADTDQGGRWGDFSGTAAPSDVATALKTLAAKATVSLRNITLPGAEGDGAGFPAGFGDWWRL